MSQDLRTHQRISAPVAEPIPLQFWTINADADKLMDELFLEIDRMLDGYSKLPTSPVQPEYLSLPPAQGTQMTLPLTVTALQEQLNQQPSNPPNACLAPVEKDTGVAYSDKSLPQAVDSPRLFDKLLLGAVFGFMAATLSVWLASQYWLNRLLSQNPPSSPVAEKTQISKSDAEFIDYMHRSIAAIDRKTTASIQQARATGVQPSSNLPPVPAPSNITPNPLPVPTGLEKPYIPPTSTSPQQPYTSPTPSPTSTLSAPPAATTPAPTATAAQHKLVGLVVQGAKSVAMFNINGVTQQIHLGEKIGNTDWKLISVTLEEAIIKRNGETRSIYFGQKL